MIEDSDAKENIQCVPRRGESEGLIRAPAYHAHPCPCAFFLDSRVCVARAPVPPPVPARESEEERGRGIRIVRAGDTVNLQLIPGPVFATRIAMMDSEVNPRPGESLYPVTTSFCYSGFQKRETRRYFSLVCIFDYIRSLTEGIDQDEKHDSRIT